MVVKTVLEKFRETFKLDNALPAWPHRGHPLFPKGRDHRKIGIDEANLNSSLQFVTFASLYYFFF